MRDYHVHSNYSDGYFLESMVRAAEEAGLDGIGFADHCTVSGRDARADQRCLYGTNLDVTHDRRRRAIELLSADASVEVYDAVEMNYQPRDEAAIRAFLDDVPFDYVIGSVHRVDERNVQRQSQFSGMDESALDAVVDTYFERIVSLIESELFDVVAHVDLVERNPALRGRPTTHHYERVASALAASTTIPEVNAGQAFDDPEVVHPSPAFLDVLAEYGVSFTVGTDAHRPGEISERAEFLAAFCEDNGIEARSPRSRG